MKKTRLMMVGDRIIHTWTLEGLRTIVARALRQNLSRTEDANVLVLQYYL